MNAKEILVKQAENQNKQYPQYKGHWDDKKWEVGTMLVCIRTKMGVAFKLGDRVLVDRSDISDVTGYSFRNKVDTSIPFKHVQFYLV